MDIAGLADRLLSKVSVIDCMRTWVQASGQHRDEALLVVK